MQEKKLERWAVEYAKAHEAMLLKWVCPGPSGVPDRILIKHNCEVLFIEFKSPAGKLTPLQKIWQMRLPRYHVIRTREEFEALL